MGIRSLILLLHSNASADQILLKAHIYISSSLSVALKTLRLNQLSDNVGENSLWATLHFSERRVGVCVCVCVLFATHCLCNQYAGGTVGTKTDRGVWPPAHSKLKDRDKEEEAPHIFTGRSISSLIHAALYLDQTKWGKTGEILLLFSIVCWHSRALMHLTKIAFISHYVLAIYCILDIKSRVIMNGNGSSVLFVWMWMYSHTCSLCKTQRL